MLSAVIITKNEETKIRGTIRSLDFCDEVIVVDDYSTDQTTQIAKTSGARIYKRSLNGNFAAQRNFGLAKARGDWVLFLDTDETVPPPLAQEIIRKLAKPGETVGFYFKRLDYFLGKPLRHGETGSVRLVRLARKDTGLWHRSVHETWSLSGPTKTISHPLHHHPHPDITSFLATINAYTTIEAKLRAASGARFNLFACLFYPPLKFLYNYFIKLGFLDGFPGLVMAVVMSLHSLCLRVKLYEVTRPNSLPS